jgi:hypothetical protein
MRKMNKNREESKKSDQVRRGTGTIIAASFLILIIVSGYTLTVILNTQTKGLNEVIGEMNMFDWQRGNEIVSIVGNPFDADDKLNITVKNTGEVTVNLNWITVRNSSTLKPILNYSPIQAHLRPGETVTEIGTNIEQVFPGSFEGTSSYIVQVLTTRGTIKSLQHPPLETEYTPVINKIYSGPFEFDQETPSFRYTSEDMDGNTWVEGIFESNYTDNPIYPELAYKLKDCYDHIVYSISFKNVENRTVEIHASSFLLIIVPQIGGTGETELYNYIVDPESNSNNLIQYNHSGSDYEQSIVPGQTGVFKFASLNARGEEFVYNNSLRGFQGNDPETENLLTTFLVIFWRFQGTEIRFGQTIPLGSIHLDPYQDESMCAHVVDLDGSTEFIGGEGDWKATVMVTVHDSNDIAMNGAKVRILWSEGGIDSLYTNIAGKATFSRFPIDSTVPNVTLTVDNILEIEPETYTPYYNEDPDGDSDGTSIIIEKP